MCAEAELVWRGVFLTKCLLKGHPTFSVKPMFYCDAKTFGLGPRVGLDPPREISPWEYQHVGIYKR